MVLVIVQFQVDLHALEPWIGYEIRVPEWSVHVKNVESRA
jgi:hypothetical protein